MNQGVRPHKLWHWIAIAVITATVIHNPGGSAEFTITALDKAGSAIGWTLDRGGFDGESDYFTDPNPAEDPPPEPQPEADGVELSSTARLSLADWAVVEIVELHEIVEAVFAEEGH
jgi:hypothetical protein